MAVNGLVVMTPTSIASTGAGNSSSINADGSVDFTNCATLSLNGVFTTTYDNYMIVMRTLGSTTIDGVMRLRAGGTDSSTNYAYQFLRANSTTVDGSRYTSQNYWNTASIFATQRSGASFYLFGPFLSQPTAFRSVTASDGSSATVIDFAGTHSTSSAYDGFTYFPAGSGSITGLVTVFGFNQ